jgi:uncharacterized peroxidase-related enzyme
MAHIKLHNEQLPGIVGLLDYSQRTAKPLNDLAEVLLVGNSTLSKAEREIIASSVSYWNDCHFCHTVHGAAAVAHLGSPLSVIDDIKHGLQDTEISPKLRSLLDLAHQVQQGGKKVLPKHIAAASMQGATDQEIHDTVLIAAAFCMFNRYVDGLATWSPGPIEAYGEMGQMLAERGYAATTPVLEEV